MERDEVVEALNALVDRGHVRRGLRADCSLCDSKDLRQLDDAPAAPICRACDAPATYHPGTVGEPALFYSLSALMRIICANGGLPLLAAAAVFELEGAYLLPGVDVLDQEDENVEVDLLGWQGGTLFAGESKRAQNGFTDVARDVSATAALGADLHVAVTLDVVKEPLRQRMERVAQAAGLKLRVLDAPELFLN